jgi:hypothetical protein
VFHEYVVPPAAVKVALCPLQIVGELTVIVGREFTVTVATAVFEQPEVVPVTVYVVVEVGETVNGFAVEPVFQEYVVPPAAVNVALCPLQIVGELTVIVGREFTVTVATAVFEHPEVVPVTVYVVVEVGETVNGFAVDPVFHEYVVPPAAVNVALCPLQIVGELTVIVGREFTVTVATAVFEQPEVVPVTV